MYVCILIFTRSNLRWLNKPRLGTPYRGLEFCLGEVGDQRRALTWALATGTNKKRWF